MPADAPLTKRRKVKVRKPASRTDAAQRTGANTLKIKGPPSPSPTQQAQAVTKTVVKAAKPVRKVIRRQQANNRVSGDRPVPGGRTHGIDARKSPEYRDAVKYLVGKERARLKVPNFGADNIPAETPTGNISAELHVLRDATRKHEQNLLHPLGKDTYFSKALKKQVDVEGIARTNNNRVNAVEAGLDSGALKVLDQTTRPLHAIAGAVDALAPTAKKGSRSAGPLKRFVRGLQNKDKTTFGDVLKHAGAPKGVAAVAGFGLDVAADPTTYLTLGTGSVAKKAAASAAQSAEKTAALKGLSAEQAQKFGERAGRKALRTTADRKGLTVKFAGKEVPGVRTATAKVVPRKVVRRVADSRPGQAIRHGAADVNPNAATEGISKAEAREITRATRTARASTHRGAYNAQQRAIAIKKQIGSENYQKVIDAIEAGDLSKLTPELAEAAHRVRSLFKGATRIRRQAGVAGGEVKARKAVLVPAVTARAAPDTARDVGRAQRRVSAAERRVSDALENRGVTQGRAEILSREVSGARGEAIAKAGQKIRVRTAKAAAAAKHGTPADVLRSIDEVLLAHAKYPGGAHGVGLGIAKHDMATTELKAARDELARVVAVHGSQKELRAAELAAVRKADAANAKNAIGAQGYIPHVPAETVEVVTKKGVMRRGGVGQRTVKSAAVKTRTDTRPLATIRKEAPGKYSEDLPQLLADHMSDAARSAAKADLNRRLAEAGRPVARNGLPPALAEGEGIYHVKGSDIREVSKTSEISRIVDATLPKDAGRFVVLNKNVVDKALEGAAPQLQGPGIIKGLDKAQGGFKAIATVPNPGFHIRNLIGDTQNAYLAESSPRLVRNMGQSARALKQLGRREEALRDLTKRVDPGNGGVTIRGVKVPYEDLVAEAERTGAIRSGFIARELPELAQKDVTKGRDRLHHLSRLVQNREDVVRLATYIGSLKRGMSPEQAAERAAKYHFDYGHLTPFERNFARRAMPFYTFSARNIPLQARTFVTKPGKYANYQKIREEAATATGLNDPQPQEIVDLYDKLEQAGVKLPDGWERYLSAWETRNAGVPIKVGDQVYTISAALPLTDVGVVPGGVSAWFQRAADLTTPIVKTPTELALNYSTFFHDNIESDTSPLVTAPVYVGAFPAAVKKRLGVVKGTNKRSGRHVWMWPGRVDYVAHAVPGPTNYAQQFATDTPGKSLGSKVLSYSGVKATPVDPAGAAIGLAYERMFAIQKRQAALRQQGISADNPTAEYTRLAGQLKLTEEIAYMGKAARGDAVLPSRGGPRKIVRRTSTPTTASSSEFAPPGGSADSVDGFSPPGGGVDSVNGFSLGG